MNEAVWNHILLRRVVDQNGCWLWSGAQSTSGYGRVSIGGKLWQVHRVAAVMKLGLDPKSGLLVLHHCDTKLCFNPDHLFLGTQSDNMCDALAKGKIRAAPPPLDLLDGEVDCSTARALLAIDQIRAMRALRRDNPGMPYRVIASQFGVSEEMARLIVLRKRWKYV